MKNTQEYNINIFTLSNKLHHYHWDIDDSFFDDFVQYREFSIKKGDLYADISLTKSDMLIKLSFKIKGNIELCCDKSLELFDHHISIDKDLIIKFGEKNEELTDEMIIIRKDTQVINITKYLYDFIMLAIPMKKIHPRFLDEYNDIKDETTLIYSSNPVSENDEKKDGLWDTLKKLNTDYTDNKSTVDN